MSGYNWVMPPMTGTSIMRIWGLRGATVYCQWCRHDTDHNTEWHRWWMKSKRGRKQS